MSPIHFSLLQPAFNAAGYNLEVLPNDNKEAVDVGLKYARMPALLLTFGASGCSSRLTDFTPDVSGGERIYP